MWGLILGFLPKLIDPIATITNKIIDLRAKQIDAQTEQERIHVDEQINVLRAQQAVLVAEASHPINAWARFWLMFPPSVYTAKIFVWDKVLGWGSTDNLSTELWWIVITVYGFYFVSSTRWFRR